MIYTILFSLIKGLSINIKKKLIDESINTESAFLKLRDDLKKINTVSSNKILNQINSISLLNDAEKIIKSCNDNDIKPKLTVILTNLEINQYVEAIIGNFYKLK
tara:strand:- start:438 stop:749 length:312 start_codon:yes stop_codon:yes gene_type:complete